MKDIEKNVTVTLLAKTDMLNQGKALLSSTEVQRKKTQRVEYGDDGWTTGKLCILQEDYWQKGIIQHHPPPLVSFLSTHFFNVTLCLSLNIISALCACSNTALGLVQSCSGSLLSVT